jgi:DNA-binding NarL/FixJ family response regulator
LHVSVSVSSRAARRPSIALIGVGDASARATLSERLRTAVHRSLDSYLAGSRRADAIVLRVEREDGPPGVEVGRLLEHSPGAPVVVVLAGGCDGRDVRTALGAGAAGLIEERHLARALESCLLAVLAGQVCVPREHRRQVAPPVLSTREKQILGMVVMGYMNGEIARRLFVAESTVKSHLSSAFSKLGVRSRSEAATLILDPERGLGIGILAVGGEPLPTPTRSPA